MKKFIPSSKNRDWMDVAGGCALVIQEGMLRI